jgi:hypothetical protein
MVHPYHCYSRSTQHTAYRYPSQSGRGEEGEGGGEGGGRGGRGGGKNGGVGTTGAEIAIPISCPGTFLYSPPSLI